MSWFAPIGEGDMVAAKHELTVGLMGGRVGARRKGLVRDVSGGLLFGRRLDVEFEASGGTVRANVSENDVRLVARNAAARWQSRQSARAWMRTISLILLLPALVPAALYLIKGGNPATLIADVAQEALNTVAGFALPLLPAVIVSWIVWSMLRSGKR